MSEQGVHGEVEFKDTDPDRVDIEYPYWGYPGTCAKCGHPLPTYEFMQANEAPWPCPECDCGHREAE